MNKFFEQRQRDAITFLIPQDQIAAYRDAVIAAMELLGASEEEKALVCDATIRNSIRNRRRPEDVAWAILQ